MMAGTSETFDIGRDANGPVSDEYRNEGVFTGDIKRVQVDMKMPSTGSPEPAARKAAQGGG